MHYFVFMKTAVALRVYTQLWPLKPLDQINTLWSMKVCMSDIIIYMLVDQFNINTILCMQNVQPLCYKYKIPFDVVHFFQVCQ